MEIAAFICVILTLWLLPTVIFFIGGYIIYKKHLEEGDTIGDLVELVTDDIPAPPLFIPIINWVVLVIAGFYLLGDRVSKIRIR